MRKGTGLPAPKAPSADVSLIHPVVLPTDGNQELYAQELESYASVDDEEELAYERRVRQAFHIRELKQIDEILKSRKEYANKIFCLVVGWLASVAFILLLCGFGATGFKLDSKVLLALVGGTTINVLGIFTIVANFLFPKNGHAILSQAQGRAASASKKAKREKKAAKKKKPVPSAPAPSAGS